MKRNNYKMTTVYEYAKLLDKDLTSEEQSIKKAIDKYMYKTTQAKFDADILEQLLA